MKRILLAYINDAHVGTLVAEDNIWRFEYTDTWATDNKGYDLSPNLPRVDAEGKPSIHIDGSTTRPVQWYFDNLLPEETLRTILAKEAKVAIEDAFGLLEAYGRESAGSLTLLPEGVLPEQGGKRKLSLKELSDRIKAMPRIPLNADSPKKMSLAGAQHKLAVIYQDGEIYEPDGQAASTHILKPEHPEKNRYPSTVINEYFTMRVANLAGLDVPKVYRLFCPEPVYLIERFDRAIHQDGRVDRLHVIDGCQLLNIDRVFKYDAASTESLAKLAQRLSVPAVGRLWFFDWIVFNILMGNGDNHLKNISFMVSHDGIQISPCYDLLSTAAYETQAIDKEHASWPKTDFPIRLGQAQKFFSEITREDIIETGKKLGLSGDTATRRLNNLLKKVPLAFSHLKSEITIENAKLPEDARWKVEGDGRMIGIMEKYIMHPMVKQLSGMDDRN
ncbi:HipA domain-containing protein [Methylophilus sp. YYY-1]|uniref:HipA domain-containing protein n=1 Tax=Methylophilus sp. YYY-1 TaxID=2682087 RepID=UPI0023B2435E|nr:HipA domain-containing protein [Methylophilus sp. YYY-1]MDF0377895.1 type II toxin-antitoxin system HipA family toxin [Methylophilus sp. YYY-1]